VVEIPEVSVVSEENSVEFFAQRTNLIKKTSMETFPAKN
jgi:hypothetical protein